ncbi:MAG: hypothetical protein IKV63_00600, partial [Clostridia bacterium]|nr:hypothetical protein [Clostridia bacterium]
VFVVTNALRLRKFMPNKADGNMAVNHIENVCHEEKIVINNNNTEEKENTTMITLKIEGMMCQH